MIIYDSLGVQIFDIEINQSTKLKKSLRGTDVINAIFVSSNYYDLKFGDYILWRGVKYSIMDEPSILKARSNEYRYNIDFKAPKYQFTKAVVLFEKADQDDNPILVSEFFIFGNLLTMLNEIVLNINRVLGAGTVVVGNVPSTENKNVQFLNIDGLTAIDDVVALWEYEWYLNGNSIEVLKIVGDGTTKHSFQFKNGLKTIERKKLRENELTTRLYAYGSERNVTVEYGWSRVRIPPIEANVSAFGVIEKTKIWEDIFPHRVGTVKAVGSDVFTFSDSAMDFDLNQHLIGIPAKVSFNTGDLQGYEFELVSYDTATQTFVLQEYSDETGLSLPNEKFFPKVNDVFILHDIKLPDVYFRNAEEELSIKAEEWMETASFPTVEYEVKPDITKLRADNVVLDVGDTVIIKDSVLGVDIETRITDLQQTLAEPFEYVFKVGNKTGEGFIKEISSRTSVINNTVQSGFGDTYVQINHLKNKNFIKNETVIQEQELIGNTLLKEETKGLPYVMAGFKAYPNYADNPNDIFFESGTFHHFTIQTERKEWTVDQVKRSMADPLKPYFVYVQCEKAGASGLFLVSTNKLVTDSGSEHYYFLVGALTEVLNTGQRKFTSLFGGTGNVSENNLTLVEGGTDSPQVIADKYHSVNNVNQFTDVLYTKLVNMQQTANIMTLAFQTPLRIKAEGNPTQDATEKNDVILMRFTNGEMYWAIYSGSGDVLSPLSYRLLSKVNLTLFP